MMSASPLLLATPAGVLGARAGGAVSAPAPQANLLLGRPGAGDQVPTIWKSRPLLLYTQSQLVFSQPFPGNDWIKGMVVCNNQLYFAAGGYNSPTGTTNPVLKIYRMNDPVSKTCQNTTPAWKQSPDSFQMATGVYEGYVFVGTGSGEVRVIGTQREVGKGLLGSKVIHQTPAPAQLDGAVNSMAVFQNCLYAVTTNHVLYRGQFDTETGHFGWQNLGVVGNPGPQYTWDGCPSWRPSTDRSTSASA